MGKPMVPRKMIISALSLECQDISRISIKIGSIRRVPPTCIKLKAYLAQYPIFQTQETPIWNMTAPSNSHLHVVSDLG